jgi:hypothetical protein
MTVRFSGMVARLRVSKSKWRLWSRTPLSLDQVGNLRIAVELCMLDCGFMKASSSIRQRAGQTATQPGVKPGTARPGMTRACLHVSESGFERARLSAVPPKPNENRGFSPCRPPKVFLKRALNLGADETFF